MISFYILYHIKTAQNYAQKEREVGARNATHIYCHAQRAGYEVVQSADRTLHK